MAKNGQSEAALAALLDEDLDALADLPEFKPFPEGAHRVTVTIGTKEINKHPSFEVKLVAIETLELADSADQPLEKGAETSTMYMRDNEIGQGKFKDLMTPLGEHFGTRNIGKLIAAINGSEFLAITKKRADKEKEREYTDIVSLKPL